MISLNSFSDIMTYALGAMAVIVALMGLFFLIRRLAGGNIGQRIAQNYRQGGMIIVIITLASLILIYLLGVKFLPVVTSWIIPATSGGGATASGTAAAGSEAAGKLSTYFSPIWFLGFVIALIGAVFSSNNTQSRVSWGLLGLAFFCMLLAIGPEYSLNIRIGKIADQLISSQGIALLLMAAGIALIWRLTNEREREGEGSGTQNKNIRWILGAVLFIAAFSFAVGVLQSNITPASTLFKAVTGLEFNLNVILTILIVGILWKGKVESRFIRFILYLSLLFLIPASIGKGIIVIKDGFNDFSKELPNWSMPNFFKEIWQETDPFLKKLWKETSPVFEGLSLGMKWAILLGIVSAAFFFLLLIFKSPAAGPFFAIFLILVVILLGTLALQEAIPKPGVKSTIPPSKIVSTPEKEKSPVANLREVPVEKSWRERRKERREEFFRPEPPRQPREYSTKQEDNLLPSERRERRRSYLTEERDPRMVPLEPYRRKGENFNYSYRPPRDIF